MGSTTIDDQKRKAAAEAVKAVMDGQVIGLGTGSTSRFMVEMIGERHARGDLRDIVGIPTSEATRALAESYGIPLAPIERYPSIDLAIDGADEVDPALNLVKGLGGALLREKAVEIKARRFIVIVDESKLVERLGTKAPVPVEVPRDRTDELLTALRRLGVQPALRGGADAPFVTDGGNHIIDAHVTGGIDDPRRLEAQLEAVPGVIGHGLFLGMASEVIVAAPSGVRVLRR